VKDENIDEKNCEDRFHIASIQGAKRVLLGSVRSHWGIENGLHWTLDLAFDEDRCRVRKDNGPENFAILRHIALNLLKQEQTCKRSIKGKRLMAGWREDYLLKVLSGLPQLPISVNHRFDKRANFGKVKSPNQPNQRGPTNDTAI